MKAKSSRALQVNLADYRVDVTIDPKYRVIQDVMSKYDGIQRVLNTFLEELCHPYKNWQFIVDEARTYSLTYFYDLKSHPKGPEAARLYVEIAIEAIENAKEPKVKIDSFHYLYMLLQKFITESGSELSMFLPVVDYGFKKINNLPGETISLISRSYYQLKRLAEIYLKTVPPGTDFRTLNSLLINYFEYTFSYWLSENDPQEWFEEEIAQGLLSEVSDLFKPISHSRIKECQNQLNDLVDRKNDNSAVILKRLLELPGYGDFVSNYKSLPDEIFKAIANEKQRYQYKLIFLFHSMNISGLSNIHEETLREINRNITWLISHEDIQHIQRLIQQTFNILNKSIDKFPDTVLKSVLNMSSP
jgi:pyruvate,orthophosphate dikinase